MSVHRTNPPSWLAGASLSEALTQEAYPGLRYLQTGIRSRNQADGLRFRQELSYLSKVKPPAQERADIPVLANNMKKDDEMRRGHWCRRNGRGHSLPDRILLTQYTGKVLSGQLCIITSASDFS